MSPFGGQWQCFTSKGGDRRVRSSDLKAGKDTNFGYSAVLILETSDKILTGRLFNNVTPRDFFFKGNYAEALAQSRHSRRTKIKEMTMFYTFLASIALGNGAWCPPAF